MNSMEMIAVKNVVVVVMCVFVFVYLCGLNCVVLFCVTCVRSILNCVALFCLTYVHSILNGAAKITPGYKMFLFTATWPKKVCTHMTQHTTVDVNADVQ